MGGVGLYFPEGMLRAIEAEATRLDRSVSWVVERAWLVASGATSPVIDDRAPPRDGPRVKRSIYVPLAMHDELTRAAVREDRSMSFFVQRAILVAWPTLTALPADS